MQKLTNQIDVLSLDVQKEYEAKNRTHTYIGSCLEDLLPKFQEELSNEVSMRSEIEQRIYEQFYGPDWRAKSHV